MGACAAVVDIVACMDTQTSPVEREKRQRQKHNEKTGKTNTERMKLNKGRDFFFFKEIQEKFIDVKRKQEKKEWVQAHLDMWVE